jgi:hypothetical protein
VFNGEDRDVRAGRGRTRIVSMAPHTSRWRPCGSAWGSGRVRRNSRACKRHVLSTARRRILATRSATGGWARNRLSSHPTRPDANPAAVGSRRLWRARGEGAEPSADARYRRAWTSQGHGQLRCVPTAGRGSFCSKSGTHHGLKCWLRMPRCWKRALAVAPSECTSPGERRPPIPPLRAPSPSPDH